jgi:hypothetical protein
MGNMSNALLSLAEISNRTGIEPRVLRYVLEHDAVPFAGNVGRGRGTARHFSQTQAFILALAALMFDAGLRRSAVVALIGDLAHFLGKNEPRFEFTASDQQASMFVEIADGLNFRTRRIGGTTSDWLQIGTRASLGVTYRPLVVIGFDAAVLGRRLFGPGTMEA